MGEARVIGSSGGQLGLLADARSVSAETTQQNAEAVISSFGTQSGPFAPGSTATLIQPLEVTLNNTNGFIIVETNLLDSGGGVQSTVAQGQQAAGSGDTYAVAADTGGVTFNSPGGNSGATFPTPSESGTTFYAGVRVWSSDESKPSYPSPSVAAQTRQVGQQSFVDGPVGKVESALDDETVRTGVTAGAGLLSGLTLTDLL